MLLPLTAFDGALKSTRNMPPCRTKMDAVVASAIGINSGKNTLHLDWPGRQGTIVLHEKLVRGRISSRRSVAMPSSNGSNSHRLDYGSGQRRLSLIRCLKTTPDFDWHRRLRASLRLSKNSNSGQVAIAFLSHSRFPHHPAVRGPVHFYTE